MSKNTTTSAPKHGREKKAKPTAADLARLIAEREKAKKAKIEAMRRARLAAASVTLSPGTATDRRTYTIRDFGGKLRADVDHIAACLPRGDDRTPSRVLAWQEFDRHYQKANPGDMPPQSFMPKVDCSGSGTKNVRAARSAALEEDEVIRTHIGNGPHSLLVAVIPGGLTLDRVGATPKMLTTALDLVAGYFKCGGGTLPIGVARVIREHKVPRAFTSDNVRAARRAGASVRDVASEFSVSYREALMTVQEIESDRASR